MDQIDSLREALSHSPDNVPLRMLLADSLLQLKRYDEAEQEYRTVLSAGDNEKAKLGLAKVFLGKENPSAAIVVLEELTDRHPNHLDALVLLSRALLKEHNINEAIKAYQKVLRLNPNFTDEELDNNLRVSQFSTEQDLGLDEQWGFMQKPDVSFDHVGGMHAVKKEIEMKIILPLKHPELYKSYGKKTGGGILLYGPPGCGKTHIARATAGQVNARFISVALNDILDMWIGNSEKNLHEIFEVARKNTPCVLFFDEIDALGASRSDMKQSAGRHLINQFLQELDGIESSNEGVLVLGATNTPWHLDAAFRRPGRFDRIIFVPPPDDEARESIFRLKLKGKPTENIHYAELAKKTQEYSGADIEAVIDIAIEAKLEESFKDGVPKPIKTADLLSALKKHKPSTREWFSAAKNYALYANDSGLYDDILTYMKIKK